MFPFTLFYILSSSLFISFPSLETLGYTAGVLYYELIE